MSSVDSSKLVVMIAVLIAPNLIIICLLCWLLQLVVMIARLILPTLGSIDSSKFSDMRTLWTLPSLRQHSLIWFYQTCGNDHSTVYTPPNLRGSCSLDYQPCKNACNIDFPKFALHQQNSGNTLALLTRPSYYVSSWNWDRWLYAWKTVS
jgi:hypothetical protein